MTASGPFVAQLLQDRDPQAVVAYADPRHLFTRAEWGLEDVARSAGAAHQAHRRQDVIWIPQPDAKLGKMRWVAQDRALTSASLPGPKCSLAYARRGSMA